MDLLVDKITRPTSGVEPRTSACLASVLMYTNDKFITQNKLYIKWSTNN